MNKDNHCCVEYCISENIEELIKIGRKTWFICEDHANELFKKQKKIKTILDYEKSILEYAKPNNYYRYKHLKGCIK